MAVVHSILQMIYYLLVRKEPYIERGANYFDPRRPVDTAKRLTSRLEKLGCKVTLKAAQAA